MLLETAKDQICMNQVIGETKEMLEVHGDIIVNDIKPDVLGIISTNGIASVYKKEVLDGKVRLDGSINTYIIYFAESDNGNVRSLNTVLDFTGFVNIDGCRPGMVLDDNIEIKNFECNILNSRKISVTANIEMNVKIYSDETVEMVSNIDSIEGIEVLKKQAGISSLVGYGTSTAYAKDTIATDALDDIAEIMKVGFRISNKEAKISYNKALVKADSDINIMYLTEDNRINTVSTKVPVMGFVDMPNISEDNICDVKCKLKNIVIKPNNAETHSIYVEAEIELVCFVYEIKNIDMIEDLYSTAAELTFNRKEVKIMSREDRMKDICNIKQQIVIPEIGSNKLYDVNIKPYITDITKQNGKAALMRRGEFGFSI